MTTQDIKNGLLDQARDKEALTNHDSTSIFAHDAQVLKEAAKHIEELEGRIAALETNAPKAADRDTTRSCDWCKPDEHGQYSYAKFRNPKTKQVLNMFFSGGQITLRMEQDDAIIAQMQQQINFCPMCGERVRLEGESDGE